MTGDDSSSAAQEEWRLSLQSEIERTCQEHSARLGAEVARVAAAGVARAGEAAASERRETVDRIAQGIRRIRDASEARAVLTALVETATSFCDRATLLLHSGGSVIGFRSARVGETARDLEQLSVDVASAPALVHAIESRDTVVTTATRHSVSLRLWKRLAYDDGIEVRVHPLVLRDTVLAVLLADGPSEQSSIIEALVLTAEAWLEALGSRSEKKTQ